MIAPWMLWAVLLGGLTYCAAHAAEHGLRALRRPVRGIWLLAIVATTLVPAWRASRRVPSPQPGHSAVALQSESPVTPDTAEIVSARITLPKYRDPILGGNTLDALLLALWAIASTVLGARLMLSLRRLRSRRNDWSSALLDDVPVLVSASDGPAVAGLLRPVIVIPGWLQQQSPAERRLILWHEQEHCLARDPALLAATSVFVALMPWNPALWLMRRRLRLAIELDCDGRVLARGTDAASYGSLLLAVAERKAWSAGPALLETPTFLERRIRAMTRVPLRHPIAHVGVAAVLAALPVLLAGGVPQPVPLLPSSETVVASIDADRAEAVTPIPASQRPQEPPVPPPALPRRSAAQPPVPPLAERDSTPPPPSAAQQDPISLERLKSLVAMNYPEVARNGSGREAVWVLMDSTRSRIKFETQRAPVPDPLTLTALAQQWRAQEEALLPPWRTSYPVSGTGSPSVEVVVARTRPGALWTNVFAWQPPRTPRSDSGMVWFEALKDTLRLAMQRLFPADTAGAIHGWFLVTPSLRVLRAERDERPDAGRGMPPAMLDAGRSAAVSANVVFMRDGALAWAPGQVRAGLAGAYWMVVWER